MRLRNVMLLSIVFLLVFGGCNGDSEPAADRSESEKNNSNNVGEIHLEPEFIPPSDESLTKGAILKVYHTGHLIEAGIDAEYEINAEIPLEITYGENRTGVFGVGYGEFKYTVSTDQPTKCTAITIQEIQYVVDGEMKTGCILELMIGEIREPGQVIATCGDVVVKETVPEVVIPGKLQTLRLINGKYSQDEEVAGYYWVYSFEILRPAGSPYDDTVIGNCTITYPTGED